MNKVKYGDKKLLVFASIGLMVSAILSGMILYAMGFITDYAIAGDVEAILEISKVFIAVIGLGFIVNLGVAKIKARYINKSVKRLKKTYIEQLFSLDLLSLTNHDHEVYLSQLSNDADRYEERFYVNLMKLIGILTELIVSIVILMTIHISLLMIAIILLVFFAIIANKTSEPIQEKEHIKSSSLKTYTNYIKESLDGFIEVKQNHLTPSRKHKFKNIASQVQDDNYDVDKKTTNIDAFNNLLQITILFSMIVGGLFAAKKLNMSIGTVVVAGTAFANSTWPMQQISPILSQMKGIGTILDDYDKTLKETPQMESHRLFDIEAIKFRDVSLGYGDVEVLSNINISIEKNDKVLIIGESGAGKSTIMKSIRRQLKPQQGEILVNGSSVDQIKARDYFQELSVVDQIGFIFNGSVFNNITLYQPASHDTIHELMCDVGLGSLDLKMQLQNDGKNISGGQRARLLLARALFMESSLIVTDEIFANLDLDIGRNIEYDMLSLHQTLINVSHILYQENIHLYTKIFRVENGRVRQISAEEAMESQL